MLLCWNGPYAVLDIIGHLPAVIRLAFPRNLEIVPVALSEPILVP